MAKKATPQGNSVNELTDTANFESALEELEALVGQMENGDLTLDDSLKAFERGVLLTRQCQSALKEAELKVQTLTQDGSLVDMDIDEFDDD